MAYAQSPVRKPCEQRGLDWDAMSGDTQDVLIDDLVHEDRECRP